ncbi:MAG: MFS transporter [Alphaproteobacteria bacterium]|nr:MFS transporter [Alphaproteobacteria bacterium]
MSSIISSSSTQSKSLRAGYISWAVVSLFFFYQYILRVFPGVMVNELRSDFSINAEQFAYFGAFYLYVYSLLQIPVGMLVDKIGVKRTVIFSILICLAGTVLIAYTHNLYLAYLSRILMGVGSACAFMCTLKIVADFLPPGERGFLNGATLTLGVVGALVAGKPLSIAMDLFGWRHSLLLTLIVGVGVLFLTLFFLKTPPVSHEPESAQEENGNIFRVIKEILSTPMVVIYAILAVGLYTPTSVLADLWGVAYLMAKYGFTRGDAAEVSMTMYVGVCVGSLLLPWLSEKYNLLNRTIIICTYGVFFTFLAILIAPQLPIMGITALILLLGTFGGAEMLCFVGVVMYAPKGRTGITLGITNTVNMIGGALAQQFVGLILDRFLWKGDLDANGNHFYKSEDYALAFLFLAVMIGLCCLVARNLKRDNSCAKTATCIT